MPKLFLACALILSVIGGVAADAQCQQGDTCHDIDSSQTVSLMQKRMNTSKGLSSESVRGPGTSESQGGTKPLFTVDIPKGWMDKKVWPRGGKVALMDGAGCQAPYKEISVYESLGSTYVYGSPSGKHDCYLAYKVLWTVSANIQNESEVKSGFDGNQNWARGCSYSMQQRVLAWQEENTQSFKFHGGLDNDKRSICMCAEHAYFRGQTCHPDKTIPCPQFIGEPKCPDGKYGHSDAKPGYKPATPSYAPAPPPSPLIERE